MEPVQRSESEARPGPGRWEEEAEDLSNLHLIACLSGTANSAVRVFACRLSGRELAVKVVEHRRVAPRYLARFLPRSIDLALRLRHPCVLQTLFHTTVGDRTLVFSELAARGDLERFVALRGPLPDTANPNDLVHRLVRQAVAGIAFLHSQGVVHRGIRLEAFLLTADGRLLVAGFANARLLPHWQPGSGEREPRLDATFCGAQAYASPELLQELPHRGPPLDAWALGAVLFALASAHLPFKDGSLPRLLRAQLTRPLPFAAFPAAFACPALRDLIAGLLHPDPDARYSLDLAANHPWLGAHPCH